MQVEINEWIESVSFVIDDMISRPLEMITGDDATILGMLTLQIESESQCVVL